MITASFWRDDRSVFVTGHTSAQGLAALALERLGAHVTGYGPDAADGAAIYDAKRRREVAVRRARRSRRYDFARRPCALRRSTSSCISPSAMRSTTARSSRPSIRALSCRLHCWSLLASRRRAQSARSETTGARLLSVYCPQPVGADAAASNLRARLRVRLSAARRDRLPSRRTHRGRMGVRRRGRRPCARLVAAARRRQAQRWNDEWLRAAQSGADMAAFSRIQVEAYLAQRVRAPSPLDPAHVEPMKAVA